MNTDRLYYSETEKILFYIPNYYMDSNYTLSDFMKNLKKEGETLANHAGVPIEQIKSTQILHSTWCKGMRVFYVHNVPNKDGFSLSVENGWDMWKWLER